MNSRIVRNYDEYVGNIQSNWRKLKPLFELNEAGEQVNETEFLSHFFRFQNMVWLVEEYNNMMLKSLLRNHDKDGMQEVVDLKKKIYDEQKNALAALKKLMDIDETVE